ncbi:Pds5a [Symbiodinium pilosum]|uniref:Pds5a protein n=1 Tax=Symbiodinium pilosum TaxID=2952 RepID=A0A812VZL7_SYMPI|nr:Pds5a [Symbiodinium pilosum]
MAPFSAYGKCGDDALAACSPAEQRDAIAALAKQALALAPAVGGDSAIAAGVACVAAGIDTFPDQPWLPVIEASGGMPAQLFAIDPSVEQRLNAALKDSRQEQEEIPMAETPALEDCEASSVSSPAKATGAPESSSPVQGVLTTPQRRPSSGPSPQTPSPGSEKRSLTGGAVSAALAAQSAKKAKKLRAV